LVWESNKHHLNKRKMKKLNLEKLKLAAEDVLQRSQMGSIYGGSGETCTQGVPCYCRGHFKGCYITLQNCINDCP
jgi:hypothetical protein